MGKTVSERAGVPVSFRVDPDARVILRHYCPNGEGTGKFLSRLIFEHRVRDEERARVAREQEERR